jgi:hypothetical protein
MLLACSYCNTGCLKNSPPAMAYYLPVPLRLGHHDLKGMVEKLTKAPISLLPNLNIRVFEIRRCLQIVVCNKIIQVERLTI